MGRIFAACDCCQLIYYWKQGEQRPRGDLWKGTGWGGVGVGVGVGRGLGKREWSVG